MTNIYCVNMRKNVGKRMVMENIISRLGGQFWDGVDKSLYDERGILLNSLTHDKKTRAAKEAKLGLFEYFLENDTHNYIILFEDDIIIHRNFYEYFRQSIQFAETHNFKLIYLGVSRPLDKTVTQQTNFSNIKQFRSITQPLSGAYGVIIHKSIINSLIRRSNDPFLYERPFDVCTLGHVQLSYPHDCYICDPQIVIPDITVSDIRQPRSQNIFEKICNISIKDYILCEFIPFYVLSFGNIQKIEQFKPLLSMFIPFVKPIFITEGKLNGACEPYDTIISHPTSIDDFMELIRLDCEKHGYTKFAMSSIHVEWTKNVGNIFSCDTNTKYLPILCPRCEHHRVEKMQSYTHTDDIARTIGLTIVNLIDHQNINAKTDENIFYTFDCAYDITFRHIVRTL